MNSRDYTLAINEAMLACNYERALEIAQQALLSFQYRAELFYQASILHAYLGQLREAGLAADSALRLAPRKPEYLVHRAILKLAAHNAASALEDIQQAIMLRPEDIMAQTIFNICEIISLRK